MSLEFLAQSLEAKMGGAETFVNWLDMHELRDMLPELEDRDLEATVMDPDDPYDGDEAPCLEFDGEDEN
mgnify:CR=1 FL=1